MAMYDNLLANVPTDLWIGGKWRKSSDGARFDVIDPATENKITSVASASVEDAKAAVDAASDAFGGWAERKPRERGEILRKAYEVIMAQSERLAKLTHRPARQLVEKAIWIGAPSHCQNVPHQRQQISL